MRATGVQVSRCLYCALTSRCPAFAPMFGLPGVHALAAATGWTCVRQTAADAGTAVGPVGVGRSDQMWIGKYQPCASCNVRYPGVPPLDLGRLTSQRAGREGAKARKNRRAQPDTDLRRSGARRWSSELTPTSLLRRITILKINIVYIVYKIPNIHGVRTKSYKDATVRSLTL